MSIKYNGKTVAGKYKAQIVSGATETDKGLIRIATETEVTTGTDNTTAVTPKKLKNQLDTKQDKKLFNKSAFTIVGSPTITDDGIASGFSGSNYIKTLSITELGKITESIRFTSSFVYNTLSEQTIWNKNLNFDFRLNNGSIILRTYDGTKSNVFSIPQSQHKVTDGAQVFCDVVITPSLCSIKINGVEYTKEQVTDFSYLINLVNKYFLIGMSNTYDLYFRTSIDLKAFSITVDGKEVFSGSKNIYQALDEKQNTLTFDTTPTANSTKPVTSGGIKTALDKKIDKIRETKYMPSLYTRKLISVPGTQSTQPYIKLASIAASNTGNYNISQLFWLEIINTGIISSQALVKLSVRFGNTAYVGTVFEILENYNGDNTSSSNILKSLTWAYNFTAKTNTTGNKFVGEIWLKIPNNNFVCHYLRPTECNVYNDYGISPVSLNNNPWTYYFDQNQNVASITKGYTQVKVVDKSTYTLKANKTDLPTIATASKTGLVKPDGKTIKVENDGTISSNVGIDLGTVLCMPFGVDESENKYRYLNGQIIVQNQFPEATKKLKKRVGWDSENQKATLNTSLVCTEEEWQAIKTASKLGQCGKFVIDDEAGTIRLPAIVNINGLTDLSKCGLIKDESLPAHKHTRGTMEISGSLGTVHQYGYYENGAFYRSWTGTKTGSGGGKGDWSNWEFRASRNWTGSTSDPDNATYQADAPVQQEAVQYPYVICVNTGVEEAERPINNYQVNNTNSYGDNKYVGNTILNNLSWLRSVGQENPAGVHQDFYNWAVANIGQPFGAGLIKQSTATDITDYDLVIDQAKQTFILPTLNGEENTMSAKYSAMNITGSPYNFTAPANGWLYMSGTAISSNNEYITVYIDKAKTTPIIGRNPLLNASITYLVPVSKGQEVIIEYTASNISRCKFIYAKGNGNLYYYVGDTLQNADLINIARMQEQITDINAPTRGYLVESYVNGQSGYRLYSDGFCEQWGYSNTDSNNLRTVTFLKPYKDTNYTVTLGASNINDPQNLNSRIAKIWSITTTNMVVVGVFENNILNDFHFYWRTIGYVA